MKFNVKFSDSTHETVGELARWMDGSMADVVRDAITVMIPILERFRSAPTGDDGGGESA